MLDFVIKPDGSISDVDVAKSSGFARLDGAAVDAASQRWHFEPVLMNGHAISCRYKVAVVWSLGFSPETAARYGFAVVHPVASDYPPGSLARHEQGQTLIWALVSPQGKVLKVHATRSTGSADLDQAAADLVTSGKWPVRPATVSGKSVVTSVGFLVVWSADGQ